jgi:hypothetical protein
MKRNFLGMLTLVLTVILVSGAVCEVQANAVYQATIVSDGDRVGIVMIFFPNIPTSEINQWVATINGFLPFLSGSGVSVFPAALQTGPGAVNNAINQLLSPVLPNNWDAWLAAFVGRVPAPVPGTNVRIDLFANGGPLLGVPGVPAIVYAGAVEINDTLIDLGSAF